MPIEIIVEDGSLAKESANSYVALAFVDSYLASRGVSKWADLEEEARKAAIVRAADVLNSYRWDGERVSDGRVMAWPRVGMAYPSGNIVPMNTVPLQVQNAQCEIAAAIGIDGTNPLAQVDTSKGAVTSERVDVIAVSYADPATNTYTGKTGFPAVDALLKSFLRGGGGKFGIVEVQRG